ncbi:2-oxo acid dehydrogenase subunit E2 [Polyangium aurulentum]|uniref:2-oxo acid dehydrogenase subunit E2 n=1 Tax=Polyangium aurulentum TaxID=2567896 RepID=UPI00146EC650|nr:2-oxo acid dehydrogenase subunit E2 [Polyangium aurulentum]UQA58477.1 2-oxo acid dehydrogenase subunit E2 [Polyangium aurulentum]
MNSTRRKLAIATWGSPHEGNIYGKLSVDAAEALAYAEHLRKTTGEKVTIGHIVGKAIALALKQAPGLNGRIVLGKFVPHATVDVTFLVALENGRDLAKTKIERADEKSIADIARALGRGARSLRDGKDAGFEKSKGLVRSLPAWALKPVVWTTGFLTSALGISAMGLEAFPFGSAIVTNVGVFGLDEGYAPPTPFARVPVYILVGAVKEQPAVVDGKVVPRPMLTITATIDHRFIDGAELATLAKVVRGGIERPWTLDGLAHAPGTSAQDTN